MKKLAYLVIFSLIFAALLQPIQTVKASAQSQILRSQVEARALQMINLTWTFSSAKNSNIDPNFLSLVTPPKQFTGVTTLTCTGIPYDWGGIDAIDTSSYNEPWVSFSDAVSKGAYTGNTNSDGNYGYIPGTAGVDCSGFVQAAFNIKDYKQSSSTLLSNYFTKINLSDLKHMDILDYPGEHVVIFDSWGTLNGVAGAFTYEATTDQTYGGIQGTKKYFLSNSDISSGYIPARYINIADDAPTPAPAPVPVPTPTPTPAPVPVSTPAAAVVIPHPVDVGYFAMIANNADWVNIHSSPLTSSSVLAAVQKGSILYISDYSYGWYKTTYNGKTGWIWGDYITSIPKSQYVTVKNVTFLNIRSSPSSTAQILGTISQNQYAKVIDYSGSWMKISINNIQGWASSAYLSYIY